MVTEELEATYDVVVVGGGAAGLSGALTLTRARRSVLVIDAGEPRNAPAAAVHGYLSRDGVSPADLTARGGRRSAGTAVGWCAAGSMRPVAPATDSRLTSQTAGRCAGAGCG